jgi:hypothetical protein
VPNRPRDAATAPEGADSHVRSTHEERPEDTRPLFADELDREHFIAQVRADTADPADIALAIAALPNPHETRLVEVLDECGHLQHWRRCSTTLTRPSRSQRSDRPKRAGRPRKGVYVRSATDDPALVTVRSSEASRANALGLHLGKHLSLTSRARTVRGRGWKPCRPLTRGEQRGRQIWAPRRWRTGTRRCRRTIAWTA